MFKKWKDPRIQKKLRRWINLGSEIFLCDPVYISCIWEAVRNSPLTMESIAMWVEDLAELRKVGVSLTVAHKALREKFPGVLAMLITADEITAGTVDSEKLEHTDE